jgi:hypothetical protein
MGEKQKVVIPAGTISRAQAEAIAAAYINADIEDDKGTHFRVVVRVNGERVWSVWNFEPNAGSWLLRYLEHDGVMKQ